MKLYYAKGTCSLASHIALAEAGVKHEHQEVDIKTHKYDGKDYYEVNPKGYVPALKLDNGELLTENAVVLQYIADQQPSAKLIPAAGTMERYHAMEWLNYISTELHKAFGILFNPQSPEEQKEISKKTILKKFELPAKTLEKSSFLMGEQITVPDFYLYVMVGWSKHFKLDLSKLPSLMKFHETLKQRPAVQAVEKREGLA